MKTRTDKQEMAAWLENIPDLYHGSFRRRWLKAATKSSIRAAVNAKCADCCCWQNVEITACTVVTCPLWQYRPLSKGDLRKPVVLAIAFDLLAEFGAPDSAPVQSVAQNDLFSQ